MVSTAILAVAILAATLTGCGTTKEVLPEQPEAPEEAEEPAEIEETISAADSPAQTVDYAAAYLAKLDEFDPDLGTPSVGLIYVDEDEIPELFAIFGEFESAGVQLYTWQDNGIREIGTLGSAGQMCYVPGGNLIRTTYYYDTTREIRFNSVEKEFVMDQAIFHEPMSGNDISTTAYEMEDPSVIVTFTDEYGNVDRNAYVNAFSDFLSEKGTGLFCKLSYADGVPADRIDREVFISDPLSYLIETTPDPLSLQYVEYPNALEGKDMGDPDVIRLVDRFLSSKEGQAYDAKDILMVNAADFDASGKCSAFLFTGERGGQMGDAAYFGEFWYVGEDTTECLMEFPNGYHRIDGLTGYADDVKYAYANQFAVTSARSYMWGVRDGKPYEVEISGMGGLTIPVTLTGKGDFTLVHDAYDATDSNGIMLGHTYKPYYFYADKATGKFCEYKGTEISEEKLTALCGFDLAQEVRDAGYEVMNIISRENGMVTVNYRYLSGEDICYGNANYNTAAGCYADVWGDGSDNLAGSDYGGTYALSLVDSYEELEMP